MFTLCHSTSVAPKCGPHSGRASWVPFAPKQMVLIEVETCLGSHPKSVVMHLLYVLPIIQIERQSLTMHLSQDTGSAGTNGLSPNLCWGSILLSCNFVKSNAYSINLSVDRIILICITQFRRICLRKFRRKLRRTNRHKTRRKIRCEIWCKHMCKILCTVQSESSPKSSPESIPNRKN